MVTPRSTIKPFDLVEHERVGGVDGIGPIDPADGDDPDRRRLGLHDADLHRARLAAEHRRRRWPTDRPPRCVRSPTAR